MNNSLSHNSSYAREFYLRTINELIGSRGILSKYIVGFEFDEPKLLIREPQNNRISIGISELHKIDLPEAGIQKNTIYDCYIGSEQKPRIRFRTNQDGKVSILFASKHIIRPREINIVEGKEESNTLNESVIMRIRYKFKEIFGRKK